MTKEEKIYFIKTLIKNVQKEMLDKANNIPKNWEGCELRWYVADRFSKCVFGDLYGSYKKRKKNYRNDVLVNNL